jgi:hypothetical protein
MGKGPGVRGRAGQEAQVGDPKIWMEVSQAERDETGQQEWVRGQTKPESCKSTGTLLETMELGSYSSIGLFKLSHLIINFLILFYDYFLVVLDLGPHASYAGALPLEPPCQSWFVVGIFEVGSCFFLFFVWSGLELLSS